MAMSDELDKQNWRDRSRLARERSDLSASVEAALADETLSDDEWLEAEDLDEPGKPQEKLSGEKPGLTIIPPRLSLQSRPMPAVSAGLPAGEPAAKPSAGTERPPVEQAPAQVELPEVSEQNENMLMRLAHRITTSLASIGSVLQPSALAEVSADASNVKAQEIAGKASAPLTSQVEGKQTMKVYPAPPRTPVVIESRPLPAAPAPAPRPAGRLGRTTKVHLKIAPKFDRAAEARYRPAVERPEGAQAVPEEASSIKEAPQPEPIAAPEVEPLVVLLDTSAHLPAIKTAVAEEKASEPHPVRNETAGMLFGTGQFEEGQSDLVVSNAATRASSVVLVMLAGDPGPVVVQYNSLQPGAGFTVHLSAAAKRRTPFNYLLMSPPRG